MTTHRIRFVAILGTTLALAAGCGTNPKPSAPLDDLAITEGGKAPGFTGKSFNAFYPLAPGNHWEYDRTFVSDVVPYSGEPSHYVYRATRAHDQSCEERVGSRVYRAERMTETTLQGISQTWILYRQDATGLFEADVVMSSAPVCEGVATPSAMPAANAEDHLLEASASAILARVPAAQRSAWSAALDRQRATRAAIQAAAGLALPKRPRVTVPAAGELIRLSYPLVVGAEWIVRIDPPFTERVEALQQLVLPAGRFQGYRIAIRSSLFGPRDVVHVWYGRDGFLKLEDHLESEARDDQGNAYGVVVSEEVQTLTALSLVGRNPAPRFSN